MVTRRKSKEELTAERKRGRSRDHQETPDVPFEALSDEEQSEINELFTRLHKAGWETAGGYQVSTEGPGKPKHVTLSAIVPSTNDWDPSQAYEDE